MTTIDEYLDNVMVAQRDELQRIRQIVHETIPEATELISYNMPGFKYNGKYLIGVGAFKNHMSIFPGTIKFSPDKPLPESTIKEILLSRLAEISDR